MTITFLSFKVKQMVVRTGSALQPGTLNPSCSRPPAALTSLPNRSRLFIRRMRAAPFASTHTTTWAGSNSGGDSKKSGGEDRIRTCEGRATRFTVWPRWPLGYLTKFYPIKFGDPDPSRFGRGGIFFTSYQSQRPLASLEVIFAICKTLQK